VQEEVAVGVKLDCGRVMGGVPVLGMRATLKRGLLLAAVSVGSDCWIRR